MKYRTIHLRRWEKIREVGKKRYIFRRVIATELGISLGFLMSFMYGVLDYRNSLSFISVILVFSSILFTFIYLVVFLQNEEKYNRNK